MTEKVVLSRIEHVPSDARVYHYDELSEKAKECLPRLIRTDTSELAGSEQVVAAFESYDLVKFVDYYRITVREEPPSASPPR
ncbi:hypothetical protein [Natrinema sp. 1APR25-10V2]|uniref:hypothetical protein n=1 Tax=Natrinema sp. 1APR25-10V2 TaxID=2951081 RepID=UPI00287BB774|nr:hypothetical protein [Natrinema sp. 1APR25-10V2]